MKTLAIFLYVIINVIYLSPIADAGRIWGGIQLITHIGFIGYLCYEMQKKEKPNSIERFSFQYATWFSFSNCVYIVACIFNTKPWAVYNTEVFSAIVAVGFLVFIIYCAFKKT